MTGLYWLCSTTFYKKLWQLFVFHKIITQIITCKWQICPTGAVAKLNTRGQLISLCKYHINFWKLFETGLWAKEIRGPEDNAFSLCLWIAIWCRCPFHRCSRMNETKSTLIYVLKIWKVELTKNSLYNCSLCLITWETGFQHLRNILLLSPSKKCLQVAFM